MGWGGGCEWLHDEINIVASGYIKSGSVFLFYSMVIGSRQLWGVGADFSLHSCCAVLFSVRPGFYDLAIKQINTNSLPLFAIRGFPAIAGCAFLLLRQYFHTKTQSWNTQKWP